MPNEENTRQARTRRIISEEVKQPKTGIITEVHEHLSEDDKWNFHVDVRITEDDHPRKVPVATPIPELIAPPRTTSHPDGPDLALVQYLDDDDEKRPIVTHILYNDVDRPPLGEEGVVRLRRDRLYAEVADDGSYARLAKKHEDDGDLELSVGIDDDDGTASLKADLDLDGSAELKVTVDANAEEINIFTDGQDINIGDENGTFKKVARKGDAVEVSDPESGTLTGSITEGSNNVEST